MRKNAINNIRLGIFIIAGVIIIVVSLYLIGQNQNFFGSNFSLKVRFRNVGGLMPGNNVRFSGIQCGTVKDIEIIDDTTIEVSMLISDKTSRYIRHNASASIGTEGLMGNKVINIAPGTSDAPVMTEGGMLHTESKKGIDDLLGTFAMTGDNAQVISANLKQTSERLNNSSLTRELLDDTMIIRYLRRTLKNFRTASGDITVAAAGVKMMIGEAQAGKSVAGVLLSDRQAAAQVTDAISHLRNAAEKADKLVTNIDSLVGGMQSDLNNGRGTAYLLLKDSLTVARLQRSLDNVEHGTKAFHEDMEALKHNFLLRGYFRKQERKKNR